jgi:hypothetical protein
LKDITDPWVTPAIVSEVASWHHSSDCAQLPDRMGTGSGSAQAGAGPTDAAVNVE